MSGVDKPRVRAAVRELLLAMGEDVDRPGLRETPEKVADAYGEFFAGIGEDPVDLLRETQPFDPAMGSTVVMRDIAFRSVCEHHLLPFLGVAHVAYCPQDTVVGLGRIPRVVDSVASRPQVQERLTDDIAEAIESGLAPRGVLVVVEAEHGCVNARGARSARSTTVTIAGRGVLTEPSERAEVFALLGSIDAR